MDNWMVANTVSISKTDEVTDNLKIETVATHPMYKTELESFVIDSKSGEKNSLNYYLNKSRNSLVTPLKTFYVQT